MKPSDITIAITVFDRREYILGAIESALNQNEPANVIVVEDCGPDLTLKPWVERQFGHAITYYRNPVRRGLFDNWNACLEFCKTTYLSILHDDDLLLPSFVETMLWMYEKFPDRALYFGNFRAITNDLTVIPYPRPTIPQEVAPIDLKWLALNNGLGFGGHVFSTSIATRVGGFQKGSWFAGDWHMWFRLAAFGGGVHTTREVVCARVYLDQRKGSARVVRSGRDHAATIVQRKRCFAHLKRAGELDGISFDQLRSMTHPRLMTILRYGSGFAPRMLRYNLELLRRSIYPGWRSHITRLFAKLLPERFARILSGAWRTVDEWVNGARVKHSIRTE